MRKVVYSLLCLFLLLSLLSISYLSSIYVNISTIDLWKDVSSIPEDAKIDYIYSDNILRNRIITSVYDSKIENISSVSENKTINTFLMLEELKYPDYDFLMRKNIISGNTYYFVCSKYKITLKKFIIFISKVSIFRSEVDKTHYIYITDIINKKLKDLSFSNKSLLNLYPKPFIYYSDSDILDLLGESLFKNLETKSNLEILTVSDIIVLKLPTDFVSDTIKMLDGENVTNSDALTELFNNLGLEINIKELKRIVVFDTPNKNFINNFYTPICSVYLDKNSNMYYFVLDLSGSGGIKRE